MLNTKIRFCIRHNRRSSVSECPLLNSFCQGARYDCLQQRRLGVAEASTRKHDWRSVKLPIIRRVLGRCGTPPVFRYRDDELLCPTPMNFASALIAFEKGAGVSNPTC